MLLDIYRRVLGEQYDPVYPPNVTCADIVSRDEYQEAKANEIKYAQGVISRATWQARDGLDPEEEQEKIDAENVKAVAVMKERSVTGTESKGEFDADRSGIS